MTKGRYREFYQCDYDIAGQYDPMIPDAECLKLASEIFDELNVGSYLIKVNHRKFLDAIFAVADVPSNLFGTIASSVDKLDKLPWETVAKEMEEKGLKGDAIKKIGEFVQIKGEPVKIMKVLQEYKWPEDSPAIAALKEMGILFEYLTSFKILHKISFDLSLVRGLSYYTGMILETVLIQEGNDIGSIAGGGRYDNLVDAFIPSQGIPAVGFSVGIERLFSIMEEKLKSDARDNDTEVMVVTIGNNLLLERFEICNELWANKLNTEFQYVCNPRLKSQLDYANKKGIPFVVLFGDSEKSKGTIKIKNMNTSKEEEVPRVDMVSKLKQLLQKK